MTHRVLTMARKGTEAEWLIDTLLRTAKSRGFLPQSAPVIKATSPSEACEALKREKNLTAIVTSLHSHKLVAVKNMPDESLAYLLMVCAYRAERRLSSTPSYLPLVLMGNYTTDGPPSAYEPLERAAAITSPDVCIVERRYSRPPFPLHAYQIAELFAQPEKYRYKQHLLIPRPERVVEVTKATTPGYGPGGINSLARWRLDFIPLPTSFRNDEARTTQTHR